MHKSELGKIPPQEIEIEEAVLGALLLESNSFYLVSGILKPEHFYKESHQFVYQAVSNLHERNSAVDILTVTQELKRMDVLEESGGAYFVSQLTSSVAAATNIEFHARVIIDKFGRREVIRRSSEILSNAYDEAIDLDEIISSAASIESDILNASGSTDMKVLKEANSEALEEIKDRMERAAMGEHICIDTPLQGVNNMVGGFMGGNFIVIGARPSNGKTAIALAFAKHQAENGFKPAFFSLEMPGKSLSKRLFCVEAGVDSLKLKTGELTAFEFNKIKEAKERLDKLNIKVSDSFTNNVAKIKASVKKLIQKGECDIVYVDYLQLMEGEGSNRQEQVSKISRALKSMANDLDIPVVAMAQLSRASEQSPQKRPKLSNLRESGAIEQDADIVILLFRPADHWSEDENGNKYDPYEVELLIEKQRDGVTGTVYAETNKTRNVYYDKSGRTEQEPDKFTFSNGETDPFSAFEKESGNWEMGGDLFSGG